VAEDVQSGQWSSSNVTIKLKDKNDHPPVFPDDVITAGVLETAPKNTHVVTVKVCSHKQQQQTFIYHIYFQIGLRKLIIN